MESDRDGCRSLWNTRISRIKKHKDAQVYKGTLPLAVAHDVAHGCC